MSRSLKVVVAAAIAVILLSSGFIGGFLLADNRLYLPSPASAPRDELLTDINEVRRLLDRRALTPPSETSVTAGIIQGLLDSTGDDYAMYFDPQQFQEFSEDSMGEFGGIGVVLGEKNGSAYVVEVYEKTPAAKAKIKPNDVFVAIDGVRRKKWATEEVVKRVRGEAGTDVELVMLRPVKGHAKPEEYEVTITRAMIEVPNVKSSLEGTVGYVRMNQFNMRSAEELRAEFEALEKKGAKSFVLDLRNNPGGLLDQAISVSSLFVKSGTVVSVDERGREPVVHQVTGNTVTDAPMVVLVNQNSASASEIVAGALQDHKRATIVGATTFGKGSVQTVEELEDGGAVKFTIARYLTPNGRSIDGTGLTPDVVVEMDLALESDEKSDAQLQRALDVARSL